MAPTAPHRTRRVSIASRRLQGLALVGCALALLLPGCSSPAAPAPAPASAPAGRGTSAETQSPSASPSATASASGSGSSSASPSGAATSHRSQGRPLQQVPTVIPAGFTSPPAGRGLSRYLEQKLDWTSCRKTFECAKTKVPLDYNKPDGEAITLALTKRSATSRPGLGTLFVNPGGPGASAQDYAASFSPKGLTGYDIVGFDPRGVGESTPVQCPGVDLDRYYAIDNSPDTPAEQAALVEAGRAFGAACLKGSGRLLQHVSTVEVARDLEVLRGLVGDSRTNLYGASYGTSIGSMYAQLFPQRVGRLVLDGAVNITDRTSISQAQGFERALGGFAAWCADRTCKLGSSKDQVLRTIADFWTDLDAKPLTVGNRQLTQQLAVAGVVDVLYAPPAAYKYLLAALEDGIKTRNGAYLLFLADQLNQRKPKGGYDQVNYAFPAVRCLDTPDRGVQGEIALAEAAEGKAPTIGPFIGPDLSCALWPVAAEREPRPVAAGAPPIVVVGTTGDPATPYEYAQWMAQQLKSGRLVTLKGFGHTGYSQSPCVQDVVHRFLVKGDVPADGTTC